MKNLREALMDYLENSHNPDLELRDDGLYVPPRDNVCPLCENAAWSCNTGAHLKQPEHYALKYGIAPRVFMMAVSPQAFQASSIAWKKLDYVESSYLSSYGGFKWVPQEVTYATCSNGCSPVPQLDCQCGLYFFWSPFEAREYYGDGIIVRCEVGGIVIEASKGCRAQCAVIRGIYHDNNSERASEVAALYDVPLVDFMEDYDVIDELQ